jgi:hypothetical protein
MALTMGKFECWERNNTFVNGYTSYHLRFPLPSIQPGMQGCQRRSYGATPTTCGFVDIISRAAHHCFGYVQIQLLKYCDHIYVTFVTTYVHNVSISWIPMRWTLSFHSLLCYKCSQSCSYIIIFDRQLHYNAALQPNFGPWQPNETFPFHFSF